MKPFPMLFDGSQSRANRAGIRAVAIFAALAFALGAERASAQGVRPETERQITAIKGMMSVPGAKISKNRDGYVDSISAPPGGSLPLKGAAAGNSESAALRFLEDWSGMFRGASPDHSFRVSKTKKSGVRDYVRVQQYYRNLPVYGGEMIVQINPEGVVSAAGNIMRDFTRMDADKNSTSPRHSAAEADRAATGLMRSAASSVRASAPVLMVYDPKIVGEIGDPQLVWNTTVRSVRGNPVKELVLVGADKGNVVLHFTLIEEIKNRRIYDSNNSSADPGTAARFEGQPASSISDVNSAYAYFGDTYDFYFTHHGRDSIDGAGMALSATTRFCEPGSPCPFANAYWDGARMYFGQGFSAADDVVAHELTHGVTENESGLIYLNQSGAINESFSDVWGEFVDLTNTGGTDTPAVRWFMGEDVPGFGALRSMKDPTIFGDPDSFCSQFYYKGNNDNGGVHTNSGVNNKLAYLLADGDTFNEHTVAGFGISKTAELYYEVQTHLLTSTANYGGLYSALSQAGINIGLTSPELANLEQACEAVQITEPCPTPPPPANDGCADAFVAVENVTYFGNTTYATNDGDASCDQSSSSPDVWFKYTAPSTKMVDISLCGSSYDTVLSIHSGCPGSGSELACDDDAACSGYQSELQYGVIAGVTYWIRIGGYAGKVGAYEMIIGGVGPTPTPSPSPSPTPGGECASTIYSATFDVDMGGFTFDNAHGLWRRENDCIAAAPGHSAPYVLGFSRPFPNCDYDTGSQVYGSVISPTINLPGVPCNLKFNYYLATEGDPNFDLAGVYISVNGGIYNELAGNFEDGVGGWRSASISLAAYAGNVVKLRFKFDSIDGAANDFAGFYIDDVVVCVESLATPTPTSGENCSNPRVACAGITYSGDTTHAEPSSPAPAACSTLSASPDEWFSYIPATNGNATFSLCGSSFDTVMTIYSSCSSAMTGYLACNDDFCGNQSQITMPVTAGTTYLIRVAGYLASSGTYSFLVTGPTCGSANSTLEWASYD